MGGSAKRLAVVVVLALTATLVGVPSSRAAEAASGAFHAATRAVPEGSADVERPPLGGPIPGDAGAPDPLPEG